MGRDSEKRNGIVDSGNRHKESHERVKARMWIHQKIQKYELGFARPFSIRIVSSHVKFLK